MIPRPGARAIAAGYGFSIQVISVIAVNVQIVIIQIILPACQSHQLHLSYENADFRKLCFLSHRIFLRQNRCVDIGTAVVVLIRLIIAIPSLIGGFDRLSILVKFFKIVFFGNAAVKLRKVTLLFVQFPGYAENLPDCRFRLCIFLCDLIHCFYQMHVLAVFRQRFIRLFHLNLQCIRQDDIAFFRAKRQLLHRNDLI